MINIKIQEMKNKRLANQFRMSLIQALTKVILRLENCNYLTGVHRIN